MWRWRTSDSSDQSEGVGLLELYASECRRLGYREDDAQRDALRRLDELRNELHVPGYRVRRWLARAGPGRKMAETAKRGIYLWGKVGRGKTWLMDLFFRSLSTEEKRRLHFYHFMQTIHAELNSLTGRRDPLQLVVARWASQYRVICLDELFVSDIGDAMLLGPVLTQLFRRGVAVVITSNLPPDDLYEDGLQRANFLPAIAAIHTHLEVVSLDQAQDYRMRKLTRMPVWLLSTDPGTDLRLRTLFRSMGLESETASDALTVNGRKMRPKYRTSNAIWFEFEDLCGEQRGAADYISLAECFPVIFVSNVPILTDDRDNEVLRFIAAIDEFYDRGTKIVASAAAPISALYVGSRRKKEFQRAESRLTEMQSQEYLGRGAEA